MLTLIGFHSYTVLSGEAVQIARPFVLSLIVSYAVGIMIGALGAYRCGKRQLMLSALTMPFYWIALFPPTLRALWELWRAPFYWHKTEHGVMARANKPTPMMSREPRQADYDTL